MTTPENLPASPEELRRLAIRAARAGGETLLEWREKFTAQEKGPADLVTDADFAAQRVVYDLLLAERPDDGFVGEESTDPSSTAAELRGRLCWVVDPLDGTANYVHGFPMFATSVGVVFDGVLIAGAIFDPLHGEMFSASLGGGAWLNDDPLSTTQATRLGEALVAISLPPGVGPDSPDLAGFVSVVQSCQAMRRTGSAALNLAYTAAGRLDAHWAFSIKPWDVAAGVLIAAEAGATISDSRGDAFDVWRADYLIAATPELHAAVLAKLR